MPKIYLSGCTFTKGVTQVPNSCIEAAELIVQVLNTGSGGSATWRKAGETRKPNVWAEFKSHRVNITSTANFHNKINMAVESYPFGSDLPALGEGICILNRGVDNDGYNMHFGAVVAASPRGVYVSNMNEPSDEEVELSTLETMRLRHVDDFRSGGYENKDIFIIGKLTVSPDMSKTEL